MIHDLRRARLKGQPVSTEGAFGDLISQQDFTIHNHVRFLKRDF